MDKIFVRVLIDKGSKSKTNNFPNIKMSAKEAFLLTEKELERLNNSIRSKRISDEHLGNSIFNNLRGEISEREIDFFVNDHFTAGYYTFLELKERMITTGCFDFRGVKKYGYIINLILFDILVFANHIGKKTIANYSLFDGWKSNVEDSKWHYFGTSQLLYNSIFEKKMLDDKFAFILSAVSLRQTLELKMQRLIGVFDYFDLNGKKIFTNYYFFFDFILKNKIHFDLESINIKILQKIFEFCNISVHKGVMPYFWQMNYALKFCDSLFYDPEYKKKKNWNVHSAVRINRYEELKVKLEDELKQKFKPPEYELYIHWSEPEAQIIK